MAKSMERMSTSEVEKLRSVAAEDRVKAANPFLRAAPLLGPGRRV